MMYDKGNNCKKKMKTFQYSLEYKAKQRGKGC